MILKNYRKISITLNFLICFILYGCKSEMKYADAVYYNGVVYTVDSSFTIHTAFAVKEGKIIATGSDKEILLYEASSKTDLDGKFVYPGFQDAHCHFYGYGDDLKKTNLTGTNSYKEVLDTLIKYNGNKKSGWVFGRGWDQNDWEVKAYPENNLLDSIFPDIPVFLLRIDGHAALVNQKALDLAGINAETKLSGGIIEKKNGKLTGLLIDAAVDMVYKIIPAGSSQEQVTSLLLAQTNCFKQGLTSVTDAGIENNGLKTGLIRVIDSLQKSGKLHMRINVMAALEELDYYKKNGKIKTASLNVQSFKLYADGSMGSRGACMLKPYTDQPDHYGFLVHSPEYIDSITAEVAATGFQLNTHCIGDSSHRYMLKLYAKYTSGKSNHRWRIEHAQVIHPDDLEYYKKNKIIPSMQPVHATSDMYWAEERIGPERIKGAYALKSLMQQNNIIASGSDFPVEHINPLYGFYAAVSRKDQKGFPAKGFMKENALSREEALRAMTIWAAYAAFNELETGSLEPGKFADFVILEDDLMKTSEDKLWQIKVLSTYINGDKIYQRGE